MLNHDHSFAAADHADTQRELAEAACPGSIGLGHCHECHRFDWLIIDDEDGSKLCSRCIGELAAFAEKAS